MKEKIKVKLETKVEFIDVSLSQKQIQVLIDYHNGRLGYLQQKMEEVSKVIKGE